MTGARLPFALSVLGHALALALLVWLSTRLPPPVLRRTVVPSPVDVIFAAPPPVATPAPPPEPPPVSETKPPPPPPPEPPPPPPPEPPPPPALTVQPPPIPLPKPPQPRREIIRRVEPPPALVPRPALAPPQTTALPPPAAPVVSAAYRGALAGWFAAHKTYPESARSRGEQGEALLKFRVDRSGRVLSHALVKSTGYPDLDAAVEAMMRGAVLPPFPADMTASDIEVSVPLRFSLTR